MLKLLAELHDETEPTLDNDELMPVGYPFSSPDNPHTEVEQVDDDDNDDDNDDNPTTTTYVLAGDEPTGYYNVVNNILC